MKHEIVQDLKAVAASLCKVPSRDEYRQHGKFPSTTVDKEFGTFTAALNAAGLSSKQAPDRSKRQRRFESELVNRDQEEKTREKFHVELASYVGKWEKPTTGLKTIMIRSDDHAQWVDPYCDQTFWDVAARLRPDVICFAGDQVDFYEISFHSKNPRRLMTLQSEINYVKTHFFEKARSICPGAQIDWLLGNHEWRLFRYLSDVAPHLSSLDCLQFHQLFELDRYQVNLIARPTYLTPHVKQRENYTVYENALCVTHGTSLGKTPAISELERWGQSGVSGHVHRHTTAFRRSLQGYKAWVTNGAMCRLKSGEEYIPDLVNWTQGFTIAHLNEGQVYFEYIDLTPPHACIGGQYYGR